MAQRAACVVGWPAKHSRSPKLHGWWLAHYRIDGAYRAEEISPEDFPDFIRNLAARGYECPYVKGQPAPATQDFCLRAATPTALAA